MAPEPLLPTFAIVGAQKAGSTDLAASLAQHPEVYLPPDEVPFFEDPFFAASDPAELTRALEPGRGRRHLGIKRPDYLGRPEAAGHLAATVPGLRVLACLRDPVDRARSAYDWYVKNTMLPLVPPDEGLGRLLDGDLPPGHPHAAELLDYGRYAHHLRRYRDLFPAEQVHVTLYEDLRAGPDALAAVHRFLGVAPHEPVPDRATNRGVSDPRRLRWLRAGDRFRFRLGGRGALHVAPPPPAPPAGGGPPPRRGRRRPAPPGPGLPRRAPRSPMASGPACAPTTPTTSPTSPPSSTAPSPGPPTDSAPNPF